MFKSPHLSQKRGIEQYQHYLGERFKTFVTAFDLFVSIKGKVIVELGTTRSYVPAGVEGSAVNNSSFWDINNHKKWDWSAGIFTRMCAMHLEQYEPEIHTVDISPDAIEICKVITNDYAHLISYHVMPSENFLNNFSGKIDLLYMDTGESEEQADIIHLKEARIAISRDLFSENAIILIDDVNIPGKYISKGRYSMPFLYQNGFGLKVFDYQVILQRNRYTEMLPPDDQFLFANKKFEEGDYIAAIQNYEALMIQKPGNVSILTNLCAAYLKSERIIDARNTFCQLAQHSPNNGLIWHHLAKLYLETGQIEMALECFQKSLQLINNDDTIASDRLLALNYCPELSAKRLSEEHFQWGASQKSQAETTMISNNWPMHIGFVFSDFRNHAISSFIKTYIRYHNNQRFKIYLYTTYVVSNIDIEPFQSINIVWQNIHNLSDNQIITQIKNDKIDILIDFAGHTPHNRLSVYAQKPAPIQMSYLGYPCTTGLEAIDYRLTDKVLAPQSHQQFYREKLIYLSPCFLSYLPPDHAPKPKRIHSKMITFGLFIQTKLFNEQVIRAWATIVRQIPNAQLLIKSKVLSDIKMQQFVRRLFYHHDISPDQLELFGNLDNHYDHLAHYHKIDVVLDSFPYNGDTTIFESLWMGVPVVTLKGDTPASRTGSSILTALGLTDFIASNESDYIAKAINLATNKMLLNQLRYSLRDVLKHSKLLDLKFFVMQLEGIFQDIRCQI
jgi:predicted O-linked N-acetylglucosamine transferase (SPINDLY family)